MKPQLVIQDVGGFHNADPDKTATRLIKGGSWKRQRVIVIMPAGKLMDTEVVLSWLNLGFPPNNGVIRILARGMEVGEAYTEAISQVMAHPELSQWEYILTLEHDNKPPPDGVCKLIERMEENPAIACIGGLYFTKGEGGVAQIWGDPRDPLNNFRPQIPVDGQLVECCGTGMGFNLWRTSMFKDDRLRKPWFKTLKGAEGFATQDLYFWGDARKFGYRCAVDCAVKVGHHDSENGITW